jgi:hypothetical protein
MQEYPKWMYGPADKDGKPQARIFQKDEVVPKGWEDHPSKVKQPKKGEKNSANVQEPTPEEKAATIASLREAGVEIADDASVDEINAAIDRLEPPKE